MIVLTAITLILILGVAFFVFAFALALSGAGAIPAWVETLNQGVNTLLSLVLVYGWWTLSAPDPAYTGRADGSNARRVLRVALCVAVATNLVTLAFMLTPIAGNAVLALFGFMLLGLVVFAVRFFAEMQYLRWLAPRIPSREHHQSAGRLMWLGPVLYTVGAACFGIGPIVALVLYIVLLNNIRRDIKIIRQTVPGMRG